MAPEVSFEGGQADLTRSEEVRSEEVRSEEVRSEEARSEEVRSEGEHLPLLEQFLRGKSPFPYHCPWFHRASCAGNEALELPGLQAASLQSTCQWKPRTCTPR